MLFNHSLFIWLIILYSVSVPPGKPRISSAGKNAKIRHGDVDIMGGQNKNVSLRCKVSGGDPSPSVTWWREDVLLDASFER